MKQTFQDTMCAAAFAEAGEFETARQLVMGKSHKKVLLGTSAANLPMEIFRHAMNLCRRVGASLEILHAGPPPFVIGTDCGPDLLENMGVDYRSIDDCDELEKELVDSTRKRSAIIFIVLHALAPLRPEKKRGPHLKRMARQIHCPVVVMNGQDIYNSRNI
jgi:hypothetical protein